MDGWMKFLSELEGEEGWDSERFSPYSPHGAMRELVETAGSAAVPDLVSGLSSDKASVRDWACRGLEWLGPRAGTMAVAALAERVRSRGESWVRAAVALEAVHPPKLCELGALADPAVVKGVRELLSTGGGVEATWPLIDEVLSDGLEAPGLAVLDSLYFRAMARERETPMLDQALLRAARGHPSAAVRSVASDFLADAGHGVPADEVVALLARNGGATGHTVTRIACHPKSDLLVPDLVGRKAVGELAILIRRRRCAGFATDPAPLRGLLAERLERPEATGTVAEYQIRTAAECAAELGDPALLESLVKAVIQQTQGQGWNALVRAMRRLGGEAKARLAQIEKQRRVSWMLEALDQSEDLVAVADQRYRQGRIEASYLGAFEAYGDALLVEPSGHAAFQLGWIDRAFGADIPPARIDWIRSLGFGDEDLLAELAQPVPKPLMGLRFHWDGGQRPTPDPLRAERALAVGLPTLAAYWSPEPRYREAADAQMARLGR